MTKTIRTLRVVGEPAVRRIKFKPYSISDLPKGFDKD